MQQVQLNYKSGHTVRINYTENANVKSDSHGVTGVDIDGMIGGEYPMYWGLDNIESITTVSVGWQRAAEYALGVFVRAWHAVKRKFT